MSCVLVALTLLPLAAAAEPPPAREDRRSAVRPPRVEARSPVLMSIESRTTVTGNMLPDGSPDPAERQVTRETTIRWLQRARPEFGPRPDAPPPVRMTREERQRLRQDIREANKELYVPGTPRVGPAPPVRAFAPPVPPPTQPSSEGR